jgi:hypothetical protein
MAPSSTGSEDSTRLAAPAAAASRDASPGAARGPWDDRPPAPCRRRRSSPDSSGEAGAASDGDGDGAVAARLEPAPKKAKAGAAEPRRPSRACAGRAASAGVALAAAAVAAASAAVVHDAAEAARGPRAAKRSGGGGNGNAGGNAGGGSQSAAGAAAWFGRDNVKGWAMCMHHLRGKWPEAEQFEDQIELCRIQPRSQPRSRGSTAHRNDFYYRVGSQIFRCVLRL